MSILIIYPHGNALNPHSGAETRIWNLNSLLSNFKFNISILHSKDSIGFEDDSIKKKINVFYYRDLKFYGLSDWYLSDFNPFYLIKLFLLIRKHRFKIRVFKVH